MTENKGADKQRGGRAVGEEGRQKPERSAGRGRGGGG
jgi:hypothetical protein